MKKFLIILFLFLLPTVVYAANLKIESTFINITIVKNDTTVNVTIFTEDNNLQKILVGNETYEQNDFEIRLIRNIPQCSNRSEDELVDSCLDFMNGFNNETSQLARQLADKEGQLNLCHVVRDTYKNDCDILENPQNLSLKSTIYNSCNTQLTVCTNDKDTCLKVNEGLETSKSNEFMWRIVLMSLALVIGIGIQMYRRGEIGGKSKAEKEFAVVTQTDDYKRETPKQESSETFEDEDWLSK